MTASYEAIKSGPAFSSIRIHGKHNDPDLSVIAPPRQL